MGVFVTLEESSKPMITKAEAAGFYHSPGWNQDHPKVQILTIEELLDGKTIQMPPTGMTFKQAQKVKENGPEQGKMFGE
jgi:site-specific DNA-methyltransferase (adenine-specific)